MTLPDYAKTSEDRNISLQKVGICKLKMPLSYHVKGDSNRKEFTTTVSVYVNVPKDVKGINMSRIPIILDSLPKSLLSTEFIKRALYQLQEEMPSEDTYVKLRFPYYTYRKSPKTNWSAPIYHDCTLEGRLIDSKYRFYLTVSTQAISTCPCSKMLTEDLHKKGESGAPHMQRAQVKMTVEFDISANINIIYIEDLIDIVEKCVPVPLGIIKREDEQDLARQCWNKPTFVEDLARDIAVQLENIPKVLDYVTVVESEESIHTHNAVAIKWKGVKNGLR